ncbi:MULTISPECIES: DUF4842 domain-containing protein [unclassified Pseudoalteromonas]|uniref:DUF4842 domain-containing protein n=1 Tax=unclassified Pseudoalteromonas TaxID=194690 RepID=UPI000730E7E0|nr:MULTISPECIES: DUF4842 domain-containing protein [unclassified Pseudoalteromonas]KTD90219.1 hypothetical protein ATS71_06820 [Pseudoalteromonas sp. H71]TMN81267.1 hypothetical protein CWB64_11905 [Pseudoalteromonas sp. S410]TMN89248.1 hypothetical protein CWB62_12895 [Pseudoalteromonas sp. S408]TMN95026.1 hypothetical protein CWB61_15790 [Pseudoalteromonas sp. S407]TMO00676.1 hypothetical protein CWB63_06300 [Pseudoalteromonas sp. S409]
MKLNKFATACLLAFPCAVLSQPFESCPSQAPTEAFDTSLYSVTNADDASVQGNGLYFLNENGLPFACLAPLIKAWQ